MLSGRKTGERCGMVDGVWCDIGYGIKAARRQCGVQAAIRLLDAMFVRKRLGSLGIDIAGRNHLNSRDFLERADMGLGHVARAENEKFHL